MEDRADERHGPGIFLALCSTSTKQSGLMGIFVLLWVFLLCLFLQETFNNSAQDEAGSSNQRVFANGEWPQFFPAGKWRPVVFLPSFPTSNVLTPFPMFQCCLRRGSDISQPHLLKNLRYWVFFSREIWEPDLYLGNKKTLCSVKKFQGVSDSLWDAMKSTIVLVVYKQ